MSEVLSVAHVTKRFGNNVALYNINLAIHGDKIIGLVGRNGAGKTTLLKILAGHLRPNKGSAYVLGEEAWENATTHDQFYLSSCDMQFTAFLRLQDIMDIAKECYAQWDEDYALHLLKRFRLDPKWLYRSLSRGMITIFNNVVALASRVRIVLMDEPTLGLDAANRAIFYEELLKDYMEHPRTFIVSSHILSELENLLEDIILIDEGSLVLHSSVDAIKSQGVVLNGKKDVVLPFIEKRRTYKAQELGNSLIVSIHNDLTEEDKQYLMDNHVDISTISAQDMCIYLTDHEEEEAR